MNREQIIRMAREAGFHAWYSDPERDYHFGCIERFAALVAAQEREACLALYEHEDVLAPVGNSAWGEAYQDGWAEGAAAYREAIRARSQQ